MAEYYLLESLGNVTDPDYGDYCFAGGAPEGIGKYTRYLKTGQTLRAYFPSDPEEVTFKLDDNHQGLKLGSYIGNTNGNLIVHKDAIELLSQFNLGDHEIFPFTLINHKGRTHSEDYRFINPLGVVDCLDFDKSKIMWGTDKKFIAMIIKYVLDANKLANTPDIFRVKMHTTDYIFSEKLVDAIRLHEYTNFLFYKLPFTRF